jgi:cell division transport system permease protein
LLAWVGHHRHSAADSLRRVLERPIASLLTWLVVGIALALPVGLALALDNVRALGGDNVDASTRLSLFLAPESTEQEALRFAEDLRQMTEIADVSFRSRDDALAEFRARSGFADVLGGLDSNPLPHVLLVAPVAAAATDALATRLAELPPVAEVVVDLAWVERLQRFAALARRVVLVLAVLLCAGVLLILGNTLRLAIEARREEIQITRLVGASDGFVRRPFLYTGLWYGLGGGACGALVVAAVFAALRGPVARLGDAYGAPWRLAGLGLVDACALALLGGALGLLAAWAAVARHLRELDRV